MNILDWLTGKNKKTERPAVPSTATPKSPPVLPSKLSKPLTSPERSAAASAAPAKFGHAPSLELEAAPIRPASLTSLANTQPTPTNAIAPKPGGSFPPADHSLEQALNNLGHKNTTKVRAEAIRQFERADDVTVDKLILLLGTRRSAATALGIAGNPRALEPLCAAVVAAGETTAIGEAAQALGLLLDRRAVAPLVGRLTDLRQKAEPSRNRPWTMSDTNLIEGAARGQLVTSLGLLRDPIASSEVVKALADTELFAQLAASDAIPELGPDAMGLALLVVKNEGVPWSLLRSVKDCLRQTSDVEALVRALDDDSMSEDVRGAAIFRLAELADARTIDPLIKAMTGSVELQNWVVHALGGFDDERATKALSMAIESREGHVRRFAILTLSKHRNPLVIDLLKKYIRSEDEITRRAAACALAELREPCAFEPLIECLAGPIEERSRAVAALGILGDPRSFDRLVEALSDSDDSTRSSAAIALAQLDDPRALEAPVNLLKDSKEKVRESSVEALGSLRDPRALDPLVGALKDSNKEVRKAAAAALGILGDPRSFDPLVEALSDSDESTRRSAATALAQLGDPRALEALVNLLKDSEEKVRESSVEALRLLRDPRALGPLIGALKDSNREVRQAAANALGDLGHNSALQPLLEAQGDTEVNVQLAVSVTLAKLGDPNGLDFVLNQMWADTNSYGIVNVGDALGKMRDRRAIQPLIFRLRGSPRRVRKAIWSALEKIGEPACQALLQAASDSRPCVRAVALEALGQIGTPEVKSLIEAATNDPDSFVRENAIESSLVLERRVGSLPEAIPLSAETILPAK